MASRLSPKARATAAVAGWVAVAAAATGAGMFAVGAIGAGVVPASPQPLDAQQVTALARGQQARQPANAQTPPPARSTPAPPMPAPSTPTPQAEPKVLSTPGGIILASCAGGRVVVRSASPAQGYQVESDDDDDDGGRPEVKFRSDGADVKVRLHCTDGEPRAAIEREGDD